MGTLNNEERLSKFSSENFTLEFLFIICVSTAFFIASVVTICVICCVKTIKKSDIVITEIDPEPEEVVIERLNGIRAGIGRD